MREQNVIEIKDGDFVVLQERWRITVKQAIKVTNFYLFYKSDAGEHRMRREDAVFSGPDEAIARRLADQLTSSSNQQDEEQRAVGLRRIERDKRFIRAAVAISSGGRE